MKNNIEQKEKKLLYVNLFLFGLVAVMAFISIKSSYLAFNPALVANIPKPVPSVIQAALPAAPAVEVKYSIEDVKTGKTEIKKDIKVNSIQEVYEKYPLPDVGSNIIANWKKLNPEERAKTIESFEKVENEMKQELAKDPMNKKMKHKLFIVSSMKDLMKQDFNLNILDPQPKTVPAEQVSAKIPPQAVVSGQAEKAILANSGINRKK